VTISLFEPDGDSGEFDEAHKVGEELVVSCRDTAELFELVEETLDDVALFVKLGVIGTFDRPISLGRNDDLAAGFDDPVAEVIGVVALVGDRSLCGETFNEVMGEGDVVALSRRADQAHGIAERVAGGVDFGAQSAAGATKALGVRPPF